MAHNKCRQKGCPNIYTDIIGYQMPMKPGADCLPCYYAGLMRDLGRTPEEVEGNPEFIAQFAPHLVAGGWTWEDVKQSYGREATLR